MVGPGAETWSKDENLCTAVESDRTDASHLPVAGRACTRPHPPAYRCGRPVFPLPLLFRPGRPPSPFFPARLCPPAHKRRIVKFGRVEDPGLPCGWIKRSAKILMAMHCGLWKRLGQRSMQGRSNLRKE